MGRLGVVLGLAVIVLLLWWAKPILLPLAVAVLLSFLLSPLCEWLERRKIPRAVSVVLVVTFAFIVLGALAWAVFNGAQQLAANITRIGDNLERKIENVPFRGGGGTIGRVQEELEQVGERLKEAEKAEDAIAGDEEAVRETPPGTRPATAPSGEDQAEPRSRQDELLLAMQKRWEALVQQQRDMQVAAQQSREEADEAARRAATQPVMGETENPLAVTVVPRRMTALERVGYFLSVIIGPLGAAGLIIIFTLFILLQRDDLRDRVIKLAAGQQLNLATQALDDATTRISKYLVAQAIVNGTYGLAIGAGLELIALGFAGEHFPSVWLWALLCATLRFIPYLGPWVAAAFPIIVSIGWWPGYEMFLATAGYIIIIELLSNNVMEPLLYGSSTGMSPVAIILAAAFWTFVWGPVGLLVATPLTTCLVVLGKYVPALRFFDILLGDEPVLSPDSRLYQRLLALNEEDADEVAQEYRQEHSLTQTFDDVLLPALALAERDRHAGHLTAERIDFIRLTMRDIVAELSSQEQPLPSDSIDLEIPVSPSAPVRLARVVILPSVDAADQTAAMMLKALLDRRGFDVTVVEEAGLTSEKLETVFSSHADVAVISAVPPRAVSRARYLVKRLQQAQSQRGQSAAGLAAATVVGVWTIKYDRERAAERIKGDGPEIRVVTTLDEAVEEVRQRAEVVAARRTAETDPKP